MPGREQFLVTIPFFAQATWMPGGPVPLRIPPPGPLEGFFPSPNSCKLGREESRVELMEPKSAICVCLRSGLFANYQMGLYLNKNQFLAAPPLLLGSMGTPKGVACSLEGAGELQRVWDHQAPFQD